MQLTVMMVQVHRIRGARAGSRRLKLTYKTPNMILIIYRSDALLKSIPPTMASRAHFLYLITLEGCGSPYSVPQLQLSTLHSHSSALFTLVLRAVL